jgi:SAM-dependent methyltransferase
MKERFDKDYFCGKGSNYPNYGKIDASKYFKRVISFIKDQGLNGRFLDVGCAFGLLLKEVSPFFNRLYGFDISKFAIRKAKEKVPKADLRVLDLEETLPYPDESFDCITALDVLEHTKNFENNFYKIVKKLKKGGYFIISLPIYSWPVKLFGFLDKDKSHVSILKENKIIQTIRRNKLSIVSKKYFLPFFRIPYIPAEVELILKKE